MLRIKKFTTKASDWTFKFYITCHSIDQARKIEMHIKRMKSSTYVQNLIKSEETKVKLLERYN